MTVKASGVLKQAQINPYISWAYADKDLSKLVTNALVNSNFLIWQRYNNTNSVVNFSVTYSDLITYNGYIADKWYIKNYRFGPQSITISKETGLYTSSSKLVNSVKISGGSSEVASLGLNVALAQDIESDKIFNLLNKSATLSFYVKSSLVGNYTCALIIFDNENNKKYIKRQSFYIRNANTTQKVTISFGSLHQFSTLSLDKRAVSAEIDISISGSSSSADQTWIEYNKDDAVVTCLSNQTNLFTGNDDYIQISNIGLQNSQPGHTIFPELNPVNYYVDLLECQEFFERVFINHLPVFYKNSETLYSNWFAYCQMNTIKRNSNPTISVVSRESKISYQIGDETRTSDLSSIFDLRVVKDLGSLYNQKTIYMDLQSSLVSSKSILYSYCNNLILDVE